MSYSRLGEMLDSEVDLPLGTGCVDNATPLRIELSYCSKRAKNGSFGTNLYRDWSDVHAK
jgi:hypothetical protein